MDQSKQAETNKRNTKIPVCYSFCRPTQRITPVQEKGLDHQLSDISELHFGTVYEFLETTPQQDGVEIGSVFDNTAVCAFRVLH